MGHCPSAPPPFYIYSQSYYQRWQLVCSLVMNHAWKGQIGYTRLSRSPQYAQVLPQCAIERHCHSVGQIYWALACPSLLFEYSRWAAATLPPNTSGAPHVFIPHVLLQCDFQGFIQLWLGYHSEHNLNWTKGTWHVGPSCRCLDQSPLFSLYKPFFSPKKYSHLKNIHPEKYSPLKNIHP